MEALLDRLFGDAAFTATEYNVLAHLLNHPNTTVTQAQLLSAVWGYQEGVKTRTLSTTMDRIRKKISGHVIDIHTVWGKGFCLDTTALRSTDLHGIVTWIVEQDPVVWSTRYYNSQTTLLDHLKVPLPTMLSGWCAHDVWDDAFVEILGRETLQQRGHIFLQQLCAQETLSLQNVRMLKRLVRHVPLDEQALTCLGDWSTSSISPTQLVDILDTATTTTPHQEGLRLSLLAMACAMTNQHIRAAQLFDQLLADTDYTPDVMSIIKQRCAWSNYIGGQYDRAIDMATQALQLAERDSLRRQCQVNLGQMYADCRNPKAPTLLLRAMETTTQSTQNAHIRHRAQLALSTYYIHTNQPTLAEDTVNRISKAALHPNNHISYIITQAQLALLRGDMTGDRWLRHHMGGISEGAQHMFDFLHALFQSQRPHFQRALMRKHVHAPPRGPWSHIRTLTALCALDDAPSWTLTPPVDAQLTALRAKYQRGECSLIDCYFEFASQPLKTFIIQPAQT